jgi:Fe-S-cluster-containing hydrogenase component 2
MSTKKHENKSLVCCSWVHIGQQEKKVYGFAPISTDKKNPKLRQKWIEMIKRPADYEPLPCHQVCSRHFIDGQDVPEIVYSSSCIHSIPVQWYR